MNQYRGLIIILLLAGFVAGCWSDSDPAPAPMDPPVPIEPVEMDVTYEYDALNRLTAVYYSDGTTERYSYDETGNLLSVERTVD